MRNWVFPFIVWETSGVVKVPRNVVAISILVPKEGVN